MKTVFMIYTLFLIAIFVLNGGITQALNQDSPAREAESLPGTSKLIQTAE